MLKNHFKSAYRHLLKNKLFSLIHICGLAVALSAGALILEYLGYELGYDQFHENKDELYRVTSRRYENGQLKNASAETVYGAGDFMKQHFPEVQNVVRFYKWPASTGVLMTP
jgi:putative ABC transport system permease protein